MYYDINYVRKLKKCQKKNNNYEINDYPNIYTWI